MHIIFLVKFFLIFVLAYIAKAEWQESKLETLQLVQVIFRHGDRAPTKVYPTDPHFADFDKHWPEGKAQLTNVGKRQQFELGQFLRRRYDGFISPTYSAKELYVTSSDMDRTIMSVESNLAGLYPPVVHPWNPELDWQPTPLRTIPRQADKYLHNYVKCPKYSQLRRDFYANSDVVQKMNREHQDFIQYCAKHSGMGIYTVKGLYPLLDVLYAQASHNLTLPEWVEKGNVLPKLLDVTGVVNTWPTYTDEMKRLWGGPLLELLLNNMHAITGWLEEDNAEVIHSVHRGVKRKMVMYSAHDSTLTRIMNTLGIFEPHCPPYAAALIIELHLDPETREYLVEFHYRNDTTREPIILSHPRCGSRCELNQYTALTEHLVPANWKKECRNFMEYDDDEEEVEGQTEEIVESKHSVDHGEAEEDDTEDEREESKKRRRMLKGVAPNYRFANAAQPDCYPNIEQILMLGLGLILSSILTAVILVKVLQYQNKIAASCCGPDAPLFVEVLGKPLFYRSGYERL